MALKGEAYISVTWRASLKIIVPVFHGEARGKNHSMPDNTEGRVCFMAIARLQDVYIPGIQFILVGNIRVLRLKPTSTIILVLEVEKYRGRQKSPRTSKKPFDSSRGSP